MRAGPLARSAMICDAKRLSSARSQRSCTRGLLCTHASCCLCFCEWVDRISITASGNDQLEKALQRASTTLPKVNHAHSLHDTHMECITAFTGTNCRVSAPRRAPGRLRATQTLPTPACILWSKEGAGRTVRCVPPPLYKCILCQPFRLRGATGMEHTA